MDLRKIKELRKQKKISLVELSKMTGIYRHTLSRMEKGAATVSFGTVSDVLDALGYRLLIVLKDD